VRDYASEDRISRIGYVLSIRMTVLSPRPGRSKRDVRPASQRLRDMLAATMRNAYALGVEMGEADLDREGECLTDDGESPADEVVEAYRIGWAEGATRASSPRSMRIG